MLSHRWGCRLFGLALLGLSLAWWSILLRTTRSEAAGSPDLCVLVTLALGLEWYLWGSRLILRWSRGRWRHEADLAVGVGAMIAAAYGVQPMLGLFLLGSGYAAGPQTQVGSFFGSPDTPVTVFLSIFEAAPFLLLAGVAAGLLCAALAHIGRNTIHLLREAWHRRFSP